MKSRGCGVLVTFGYFFQIFGERLAAKPRFLGYSRIQYQAVEPRVWEVLPAFLLRHRDLIQGEVPTEVTELLGKILRDPEDTLPGFKFMAANKYLQWVRRDKERYEGLER